LERIEGEMAEVCGIINAATGRLVRLIAELLETESWQVAGMRSPAQWVSWKCGMSLRRAHRLVAMASRLVELPETRSALEAGELGEEQVAVICRHVPAAVDAEVAELARHTTVSQLSRALGRYVFDTTETAEEPVAEPTERPVAEARQVSFGPTETGAWRLTAVLPPDEGALVEQALGQARDELFRAGEVEGGPGASAADISWADALVAMADRSASGPGRAHRDRHLVLLHVRADGGSHLHLGPGVGPGLARYLSCDSRVRAVVESEGKAVSVGRAFRIVPDRTRIVVEDRDGGCRVPGCERSRWLHVHHITHWQDGGPTDTANLLALCQHHHRLHHRGRLGIEGNADEPDGVTVTDEQGRPIDGCGRPAPPGDRPLPLGNWSPPSGERLDAWAVHFNEAAPLRPPDQARRSA
ncbi:MAG: hypothetical protein QOE93_2557, partial [Actinomycetota bacterium]|nr:hypothetical protein [Actinomycetota bacterium]